MGCLILDQWAKVFVTKELIPAFVPPAIKDEDVQICLLPAHKVQPTYNIWLPKPAKFSKYTRLLGATVMVIKAIQKLIDRFDKVGNKSKITCNKAMASRLLVKESQRYNFPDILAYFADRVNNSKPQICNSLRIFLDEHQILRVETRLRRFDAVSEFAIFFLCGKNFNSFNIYDR